jgi:hypothetical protein
MKGLPCVAPILGTTAIDAFMCPALRSMPAVWGAQTFLPPLTFSVALRFAVMQEGNTLSARDTA